MLDILSGINSPSCLAMDSKSQLNILPPLLVFMKARMDFIGMWHVFVSEYEQLNIK